MTHRLDLAGPMPPRKDVTTARIADMLAVASEVFGIPVHQLKGTRGTFPVCRARQAIFLVAREAGHSYPVIGAAFGRDHSTAVYGARKAMLRSQADPEYSGLLDELRSGVRAAVEARGRIASDLRAYSGTVIQRPAPALPEPVPAFEEHAVEDIEGLDDIELLSRRVAAHYASAAA